MFIPLKSILPEITDQVRREAAIRESELGPIYRWVVQEILGKKAAANSRALFLRNKILTVEVPSSVWACQLQFGQYEIVRKINELIGKEIVERMVFRVK